MLLYISSFAYNDANYGEIMALRAASIELSTSMSIPVDCTTGVADLSGITTSNGLLASVSLSWHNAIPIGNDNRIDDIISVPVGNYHAVFYDVANNCYSNLSKGVRVLIQNCSCEGIILPRIHLIGGN